MQHQVGSAEWFKDQKRVILRATHAVDSLLSAGRFAKRLVECWNSNDVDIRAALHNSTVVEYGKAFAEKPEYPSRHLHQQDNFDAVLHQDLLKLRHKLIAHSDKSYTVNELGLVSVGAQMSIGDNAFQVQIPQQTNVRLSTLHSIHSEDLAHRYLTHTNAAIVGAKIDAQHKSEMYLRAALDHPTEIEASRKGKPTDKNLTIKLPMDKPGSVRIPLAGEFLPPLEKPEMTIGGDGYLYRVISFNVRLKGEFSFELPDGTKVTMQVSNTPATDEAR